MSQQRYVYTSTRSDQTHQLQAAVNESCKSCHMHTQTGHPSSQTYWSTSASYDDQRKEHEAYAGSAAVSSYAIQDHSSQLQSTTHHTAAVQIDTNRIQIPLSAASYDNSDSYLRSTNLDCNIDQTRSIKQLLQPLSSSRSLQLAFSFQQLVTNSA